MKLRKISIIIIIASLLMCLLFIYGGNLPEEQYSAIFAVCVGAIILSLGVLFKFKQNKMQKSLEE